MDNQSQRVVTTVLIGAAFPAGVDLFIVNVAFEEIGRDFAGSDVSELSWILNAYAADTEAAFARAWYAVVIGMLLAALMALRLSRVAAASPEPTAVAA